MQKRRKFSAILPATVVSVVVLVSSKSIADDAAKQLCLENALRIYTVENLAILQTAAPILSVNGVLAQRRLEEQYCAQVARCLVRKLPEPQAAMAAEFSKCLRDEAKEKSDD